MNMAGKEIQMWNQLTGDETMVQVIDTAIGLEKESILFYLGLKDIVPPKLGRVKIDEIIEEEKNTWPN